MATPFLGPIGDRINGFPLLIILDKDLQNKSLNVKVVVYVAWFLV